MAPARRFTPGREIPSKSKRGDDSPSSRTVNGSKENKSSRILVALLIVGNILLAGLVLSAYRQRAKQLVSGDVDESRRPVVVRHVFHAQPEEAWSKDPLLSGILYKNLRSHRYNDDATHEDDRGPVAARDADEEKVVDAEDQDESSELQIDDVHDSDEEDRLEIEAREALVKDDYKTAAEELDGDGDDDDSSAKTSVDPDSTSARPNRDALKLRTQIYPTDKTKTFVNFRTQSCGHLCIRAKETGWRPSSLVVGSHYPSLLFIRWNQYGKYMTLGRTIVNQVGKGSSCIGGGKGIQLLCRQQLCQKYDCDFRTLGIQPEQWNLQKKAQCIDFFQRAELPENAESIWILKPGGSFHGRGITIHKGVADLKKKYGACAKRIPEGLIVQAYLADPALMSGHKFDLRSYLLIGSTAPFLAFYHEGFVRKSNNPYSKDASSLKDRAAHITNDVSQNEEDHFFSFSQLEDVLVRENPDNFNPGWFSKVFEPQAMRATLFLVQTALKRQGVKIESRKGRFQVFALDWMIGNDGSVHLLEANGDPSIKGYPTTGLTPGIWDSMLDLEERIHLSPEKFTEPLSVADGFAFEKWKLVFNEIEVQEANTDYDACKFNAYAKEKHPLFGFE